MTSRARTGTVKRRRVRKKLSGPVPVLFAVRLALVALGGLTLLPLAVGDHETFGQISCTFYCANALLFTDSIVKRRSGDALVPALISFGPLGFLAAISAIAHWGEYVRVVSLIGFGLCVLQVIANLIPESAAHRKARFARIIADAERKRPPQAGGVLGSTNKHEARSGRGADRPG